MADPIINAGAVAAAQAASAGVTMDEVIETVLGSRAAKMDALRAKQRAAYDLRVGGGNIAGANAGMPDIPAELTGIREIPNSQVEYGEFGNQDALQNFGGVDKDGRVKKIDGKDGQIEEKARAAGNGDPNQLIRYYYDKVNKQPAQEAFYAGDGVPIPTRFQEVAKGRDFGVFEKRGGEDKGIYVQRGDKRVFRQYGQEVDSPSDIKQPVYIEGAGNNANLAPAAQIMEQELKRLNEGINKYGADAFPGAAEAAGRLEDDIKPNRDAERALVREMVERDRLRQNAEVVEANNWRAQARANVIGQDFVLGGRGAAADQAIANIGNIAQIGHAKIARDFRVDNNPVDRGIGEPTQLPINIPEYYNAPVTDNRFAGPLQKQQQFIVDNVGGYREGGAFGDYPQVDIGGQLAAARDAIAGIKGVDLGSMQIRNADDLQAAVDIAARQGAGKGGKFYRREGGKNVFIENPGIIDVLQKGRMNDREIGDVARALFAVEAARRQNVNQVQKNFFAAGMGQVDSNVNFGGNHPALGGGAAQVDMIRGQKVEGKDVRAQLQALDGRKGNPDEPLDAGELAQARMPFQGAVKGEGAPRAAFVRGKDRGLNEDQLIAKYGPTNGKVAAQVIRRFEQQQGDKPDGFGAPLQRNEVPSAPPAPIPTAEKAILNQLAQNPFGVQGPEEGNLGRRAYSLAKNIARRGRQKFNAAPAYQQVGAGIGAATLGVAGINSMISGEKEKRQQEAMYQ